MCVRVGGRGWGGGGGGDKRESDGKDRPVKLEHFLLPKLF